MSRTWASRDSGMGWTVGLQPSRVGSSGCVWDVPWTLGWDGQWDCSHLGWDAWDVSGLPVRLEPSRVGRLGCVWDVPGTLEWDGQWEYSHLGWDAWDVSGLPGTLGWDGQ